MFLNLIFGLFVLMIVRQIWLLIKDKKQKKGVKTYYESPLKMSIGERMRRKNRYFKW